MKHFFCINILILSILFPKFSAAQNDIDQIQKELQKIETTSGVLSFDYGYKVLELALAQQSKKEFEKASLSTAKVDPIIRFYADSIPAAYEDLLQLQKQMGLLRMEQTFTKWQGLLAQDQIDNAQQLIHDNDWIERAIRLQLHEKIIVFFEHSNQKMGSLHPAYMNNWEKTYAFYRSEDFYNLKKAEKLWQLLSKHRKSKFGGSDARYLEVLFGWASFYDRTNKVDAFDSLKNELQKHWPNAFYIPVPDSGSTVEPDSPFYIHSVTDEMPTFPGCASVVDSVKRDCSNQFLLKFIYSKINYPKLALINQIEGMAVISFVITAQGTLCNFEIARNPGGGCGEEALRVTKLMNELPYRWTPGQHNNKQVNVKFHLPVRFKLN